MSGGVDSSVAAALLLEAGHELIGVTFRPWHSGDTAASSAPDRAAQVAGFLGIRHEVLDLRDPFLESVVEPFAAEYARGRTPSPCVLCNALIKFGRLSAYAAELGACRLATGHYARIHGGGNDRPRLLRGTDPLKDQSYFLCTLTPDQLSRSLLPLGEWTKDAVREYAVSHRLPVRAAESRELCFVRDGGHAELVSQRHPEVQRPGDLVDEGGRLLGRHEGIHRYTIGQRRGLPVAVGHPLYVAAIDAPGNRVIVGPRPALMRERFDVRDIRWMRAPVEQAFEARVQVRYNHPAAPARVLPDGPRGATVVFATPQFAVAPGQAAAFYDGDEVLGGGWIA